MGKKYCENCGMYEHMKHNSSFDWWCENCGWEEQETYEDWEEQEQKQESLPFYFNEKKTKEYFNKQIKEKEDK